MKSPFIDESVLNDKRFLEDGQFGLPLEEILEFENPTNGFYIEAHYGAVIGENMIIPTDLVYISGERRKSRQPETGLRYDSLLGKKLGYDFSISKGESNAFLLVPNNVVDMIKFDQAPEGFENWVNEMKLSNQ